jgi:hypothetical protein
MSRTSYLVFAAITRVLSALGGLWHVVLLCAMAAWSSAHVVLFRSFFGLAVTGAICLLFSIATLASHRRIFTWITLYGACVVFIFGASSFVTEIIDKGTNASGLLFVAIFFLLTITAPLFVVTMSVFDLRLRP